MSGCNGCGAPLVPRPADLDVTRTPELSGLMLACSQCGRPVRLLHRHRMVGERKQSRAQVNRALRAARRMKARQQ